MNRRRAVVKKKTCDLRSNEDMHTKQANMIRLLEESLQLRWNEPNLVIVKITWTEESVKGKCLLANDEIIYFVWSTDQDPQKIF